MEGAPAPGLTPLQRQIDRRRRMRKMWERNRGERSMRTSVSGGRKTHQQLNMTLKEGFSFISVYKKTRLC